MKILFVTPPPYLPNRLHRNRSFDLIKILSKRHEVHLLSVASKKQEPEEFKEIKKLCKSINIIKINPLKALINILRFPFLPYEVAYCYSRRVTKEIENEIKRKNIDLLYLKRLRSAIYLPFNKILNQVFDREVLDSEDFGGELSRTARTRRAQTESVQDDRDSRIPIPVVIDTTDAMSMFYNRLYNRSNFPKKIIYKLEEVKYRMFEKKIMKRIKNWIVCSEIDKNYLESITVSCNFHVIPNVVDTMYFSPRRSPLATSKESRSLPRHLRGEYVNSLLFRGLMDKPVNIDACLFFVKEVLPKVRQTIKDVQLFVVGPKPHRVIQKLHNGKDIFVMGFVKDVREFISRTSISICPVRIGSGTRYKILQAWAMGRPVVSTTIGAEGLLCKKDKNIAIADTPKEFVEQISSLLKNKILYDTLAKNGRKTVGKEYSFKVISQKIERVIRSVTLHKRHSGKRSESRISNHD